MRFSAILLPLLAVAQGAVADPQAQAQFGIIPPGLQPLINKANTLLATGQFNDAARTYSEAIGELYTSHMHFGVLYALRHFAGLQ